VGPLVIGKRTAKRSEARGDAKPDYYHRVTFPPRVLAMTSGVAIASLDEMAWTLQSKAACAVALLWPLIVQKGLVRVLPTRSGVHWITSIDFVVVFFLAPLLDASRPAFALGVFFLHANSLALNGFRLLARNYAASALGLLLNWSFVGAFRLKDATSNAAQLGFVLAVTAYVGALAYGAWRIVRTVERRRVELRTLSESLETTVAARTAALASTNAAIQRFVPREFLHALGHDDVTTTKLGDATAKSITVLFADIRNFTAYSEGMTPEETFAFLNGCLSKLGPHVRAQSGFVDKYIGDAIMALFPRDPSDAVRAAIAMQDEVHRSNDAFVGRAPLAIGVGVHVGNVMMGTIGEAERFEATVISDAVNLTARLEALTKQLECSVLMSEEVFSTLDEDLRKYARRLGTFIVKGKAQPVALYEVFASDSDVLRETKLRTRERFDAMLAAFTDERIDAALAIASELRDACPDDGPANWWFLRLVKESAAGDDAVPSSHGIVRLDEK
jgi:class 3 adenylate cyclase